MHSERRGKKKKREREGRERRKKKRKRLFEFQYVAQVDNIDAYLFAPSADISCHFLL